MSSSNQEIGYLEIIYLFETLNDDMVRTVQEINDLVENIRINHEVRLFYFQKNDF